MIQIINVNFYNYFFKKNKKKGKKINIKIYPLQNPFFYFFLKIIMKKRSKSANPSKNKYYVGVRPVRHGGNKVIDQYWEDHLQKEHVKRVYFL